MVYTKSGGAIHSMQQFVATEQWTEVSFPIGNFAGTDGHDIRGIIFSAGPQPGNFRFMIDEVRIQ
jgi:hypothetical protein